MKIKVAAIATESFYGEQEYLHAEQALKYADEASKMGAQLICFPEGYPGPNNGPMDSGGRLSFKPIEPLCEKAKDLGVYISAGNLEENPDLKDTFFLTHKLISPDGKIIANYKRVQPDHPYLNSYLMGGRLHILPGNDIMVIDTELGKIGLQICSELFVPEITRIQMLKGAKIIISPVAGTHGKSGVKKFRETWRCIARARAAENLLYVIITNNTFKDGQEVFDIGVGTIAGPEEVLAKPEGVGIFSATLDMDRLDYLRSKYVEPDLEPGECGARCGQNHDRRPDLYHKLVEPQPDAFDYFYYKKGLNTWKKEYEKIKSCK